MEPEIPQGYVRVTALLEPYSGLKGIDPLVLAKAGDRGRRVHDYCELLAQDMLIDEVDDDCKGYIASFEDWLKVVQPRIISLEERVFEHEYRLTGKFDMICQFPGSEDYVLIDYKTPQTINRTWRLQTAAYQWMLVMGKRTIHRRGCLMLNRSGGPAVFKEHTDMEDRSIFLGILHAYRFFNA